MKRYGRLLTAVVASGLVLWLSMAGLGCAAREDMVVGVLRIEHEIDLDGATNGITLDADNDTSLSAPTDDQIDVEIGGADEYVMSASIFDLNANQLDFDADNDTSITVDTDDQLDFEIGGTDEITLTASALSLNNTYVDQDVGTENIGVLPTIATAAITHTQSGAIFTIADGEIWIVHDILVRVTTNFDCTGDDCTLTIGDGNDANGFIDLVDAEMQAADTEFTGAAAGWQGMHTGTRGVYFNEATTNGAHRFVYAPSGGAETIDAVVGGTSPAAGAATIYVIYTRVQ